MLAPPVRFGMRRRPWAAVAFRSIPAWIGVVGQGVGVARWPERHACREKQGQEGVLVADSACWLGTKTKKFPRLRLPQAKTSEAAVPDGADEGDWNFWVSGKPD